MAVTTIYTYPLDGTQREFNIPFEYLARRFIVITLIGTDRKTLVLTSDYRFISKTVLQTTVAWGPSDGYERIEVRRNTSATDRLVDFADGSILRASDLNISQIQTLHVAEEARNMVADTIAENADGDLDARGRRLVNLADATDPDHAVTLRQEQAWAASTLGNKNASEAAKEAAQQSQQLSEGNRNRAVQAENAAGNSATTATTEANRAKAEADRSASAAATIGDNVQLAQTAAQTATTQKDQAVTAKTAAESAKTAAESLVGTATTTVNQVRVAAKQLGMSEWGYRERPFDGYGLDDGQELERSLFPAFAAALDAGLLPVVSEAVWQSTPELRGCFVANSSTGKFRMRDRNGKSAGSLGAVTQRGDGLKSEGVTGKIQRDAFQGHIHGAGTRDITWTNINAGVLSSIGYPNGQAGWQSAFPISSDGVNGTPRVADETRMLNVTGAWMTFMFGVITPLGSAEATALATSYASLAARVSALEARPFSKYEEITVTWANGAAQTVNHNLGVVPKLIEFEVVAKVAVAELSPGDPEGIPAGHFFYGAAGYQYGAAWRKRTSTSLVVRIGAAGLVCGQASGLMLGLLPSQADLRIKLTG